MASPSSAASAASAVIPIVSPYDAPIVQVQREQIQPSFQSSSQASASMLQSVLSASPSAELTVEALLGKIDLSTPPSLSKPTVEALLDKINKVLNHAAVKANGKLVSVLEKHSVALGTFALDKPLNTTQKALLSLLGRLFKAQGGLQWVVVKQIAALPVQEEGKRNPPPSPLTPSASPIALPVQPVTPSSSRIAFGKAAWARYYGDVGVEPPLPANINEIIQAPCPYWSGKKVKETHLLVLVPATLNGKTLTLQSLEEFARKPKEGAASGYSWFALPDNEGAHAEENYWMLMTCEVLPKSQSKHSQTPPILLKTPLKAPYETPRLIEAAVLLFTHHVQTGKRLYSNTYTRCQEKSVDYQMAVGGFSDMGINIGIYEISGLSAVRRL